MSFVSFPTDPNIMNDSELLQLKENYANMILDGMDMDSLCQFAFDMLMENLKDLNEEDMKQEVTSIYDEETLMDLMPEQSQPMTEIGALEATANDYGVGK